MIEMQAAVLRSAEPMRVETLTLDGPEQGEVRVRLHACGVCHSDLHGIKQARANALPMPTVLGHEASGVVDEVGPGVRSLEKGDPVVLAFRPSCGHCSACVRGTPQICATPDFPERSGRGPRPRLRAGSEPIAQGIGVGAFAQYCVMPEGGVIRVRKDAPLDTVCLIGCAVTTGIGAATRTARVEPGSNVAVIGVGGVGLNIVQGARLAGAHRIIAIDVQDSKLEQALRFGATHTVRGNRDEAKEEVRQIARGSLDYAFEAIGRPATIVQALEMVRAGGTAVSVGVAFESIPVPGMQLLFEKKLVGSFYGSANVHHMIPELVDLYMDGRIQIDELISKRRPLEEINEAFADLESGAVIRSVIQLAP